IEEIGIERAFEKLQKASIIMYVFDATLTTAEQLTEELKLFSSYPAIVIPVANKTDALTHTSAFNQETVSISAKNNIGMELLKQRLVVAVRKDEIKNDIIITNLRHYEALKHTADTLQQVLNGIDMRISGELLALDIRKALFHLAEITGEVTTDDLLANIFSKFCIGK
ncbi:MAG: tRNA uridine-5-carboxymethylaminomethyl(34) synthesis GTPase MnmE, partial [Bacteroidota bacterium]